MTKHSKFDIRHKETLTLFLREYFELFFPELAENMQFETVEFLDKELIALFGNPDEKDQSRITDSLILIRITLNGRSEWILIHWEQESKRKPGFEERMFHYFCGIYFKFRKLVFPIVMFTDPHKWRKPIRDTFTLSLFQYPIVEFTYRLIKLKNHKAEEFEKRINENPLVAAYLPLTDYPITECPLIKAKAMNGITKMSAGQKRATLFSLIQESLMLNETEEKQFQKLVRTNPIYQEVNMLQSIEEVGIEKGLAQGLEKGRNDASEEIAKKMLRSGKLTRKEISEFTGLKLSKINALAKTLIFD